jgi:hypothetical protein
MSKTTPQCQPFARKCVGIGFLVLIAGLPPASAQDSYERLDSLMDQEPKLPPVPYEFVFSEELKPLWQKALRRPEVELRRLAADTIALAHRSGAPDLADTRDDLIESLKQEGQHPTVQRAIANALIALDAREAAELLTEQAAGGSLDLAQLVEPALARWDYKPIREVWLERLENGETQRAYLLLAIEGLAVVKEEQAVSSLRSYVNNVNASLSIRLAAARSMGTINQTELVEDARELAASDKIVDQLLAATLIQHHSEAEVVELLASLATRDSPVVVGLALRSLFAIDPSLIYDHTASAIKNQDVNVRRVGAKALVAKSDADSIRLLAALLNDPNPGLRRYVSQQLVELAMREELHDVVIDATMQIVAQDEWRGLEQGSIVLARLDHEPIARRFVELLNNKRAEVAVTAAWGLRRLEVPETLPELLEHAKRPSNETTPVGGLKLSHLFQTFGALRYSEAEPLMRQFVPKSGKPEEARAAAVWALGMLYEDNAPADLTQAFAARLADFQSIPPESERVRKMSAISLGRMRGQSALPTLREFTDGSTEPGLASAWAIERITGEPARPPAAIRRGFGEWFLMPAKLRNAMKKAE